MLKTESKSKFIGINHHAITNPGSLARAAKPYEELRLVSLLRIEGLHINNFVAAHGPSPSLQQCFRRIPASSPSAQYETRGFSHSLLLLPTSFRSIIFQFPNDFPNMQTYEFNSRTSVNVATTYYRQRKHISINILYSKAHVSHKILSNRIQWSKFKNI